MGNYTQLIQEQRYQIYALLKMDHTQTEIAEVVMVHKSTISRELQRNRGLKGYRPMLERLSGIVLRSVEVIADQEFKFGPERPYGPAWIYFPAIVTNANLRICKFIPDDIDSGKLPDAEFESVPVVRFRKSLSTTLQDQEGINSMAESAESQERTIFIINANSLASILPYSAFSPIGYGGFPWEKVFSNEAAA